MITEALRIELNQRLTRYIRDRLGRELTPDQTRDYIASNVETLWAAYKRAPGRTERRDKLQRAWLTANVRAAMQAERESVSIPGRSYVPEP